MPLRHKGECAMKKISSVLIAVILAVLMATLLPAQVFADTPDYISEVKIFMGSTDGAADEGYTILNGEDGKPADLNADAGATDDYAKGNNAVYLGYKTTKIRSEAITDLALMNMKGGYSVKDYEALMDGQMSEQIVPFVENFLATINEYRENYNSSNNANKERAKYIHDILNKLTDDDTDGAGLGDLFLNETVYEMAKPQYEALSDKEKETKSFYDVNNEVRDSLPESEKNKHADILTIVAQSNGKATLMMQNLLTRAADTSEDTWLERFEGTTFDDLLDAQGGSPTDAMKKLAKKYDDDANTLLGTWETFKEALDNYDDAVEIVENYDISEYTDAADAIVDMEGTNPDVDDAVDAAVDYVEAQDNVSEAQDAMNTVLLHEYLDGIDYGDGTMLDFFTQPVEDVEDDITMLYPIIASLSDGQRAGLEFFSLKEMLMIGVTDSLGYKETKLDEMQPISVYEGVDRGIYKKGGVALTSDALRSDALSKMVDEETALSKWSNIMWYITIGTGAAALLSAFVSPILHSIGHYTYGVKGWNAVAEYGKTTSLAEQGFDFSKCWDSSSPDYAKMKELLSKQDEVFHGSAGTGRAFTTGYKVTYYLSAGLAVAFIVLIAVSSVLTYLEMREHYKVDYTPIPHYMVEEKDITGYNAKGEQIILKNQGAYYKAVECNRKKGDDYFGKIDTCADMNGCVNPQWLALYAAKNETEDPILADSFKVVVGGSELPQGYDTGIHFFGEKAAFNLNDKRFCWNQKAKSIMVYFKVDKNAVTTTGSNFTGGTLAISAGGGLLLGAAVTALGMTAARKRKENSAVTA